MDTQALRVLAIFLIANSHLESFYPIRQLAGDGLIGNSLFFMLSGFGLSLSASMRQGRFTAWYAKRLSRIYAPLWLTIIVATLFATTDWRVGTPDGFVRAFFWPTPYGFLTQIILFYPIFYLLKTVKHPSVPLAAMVALVGVYVPVSLFAYDLHVLSWLFYFAMMLFGGFLAGKIKEQSTVKPGDIGLLLAAMALYLGLKVAMTTGRIPTHVAFLHLLVFPIIYSLMRINAVYRVQEWSRTTRVAPLMGLLAGLTLEIYLVHEFVYHDRRVLSLAFPVNIVVFWAFTLPMAWFLAKAADASRKWLALGLARKFTLPKSLQSKFSGSQQQATLAGVGARVDGTASVAQPN